jgi:ABC-type Mn2+/Zn2+ transport system ATPase subunit
VAKIKIGIPGLGDLVGDTPVVILGPNGSGKTQLAKRVVGWAEEARRAGEKGNV